jgi:hypothetical protein
MNGRRGILPFFMRPVRIEKEQDWLKSYRLSKRIRNSFVGCRLYPKTKAGNLSCTLKGSSHASLIDKVPAVSVCHSAVF